jgi:hypothetical protein
MNFNKKLEQETGLSLEFSVDPLPGNPGTRLQVVRKFN